MRETPDSTYRCVCVCVRARVRVLVLATEPAKQTPAFDTQVLRCIWHHTPYRDASCCKALLTLACRMHAPLPSLPLPRLVAGATSSFWLASCVEAFLRGSDVRSQVLMARSGLLQHLVDGVLNTQGSGNLQVPPVAHASLLTNNSPAARTQPATCRMFASISKCVCTHVSNIRIYASVEYANTTHL